MRLLKVEQIDQLLEITRKGSAVEGSVLYKLAYDAKATRKMLERLVEAKNKKRSFFNKSFKKEINSIIAEIVELL